MPRKKLLDILSSAGSAILLLLFVLTVLTFLRIPTGISFFTVQTGSMSPYIHKGSLIITREHTVYRLGDVITYQSTQSGKNVPITHRVVDIYKQNDHTFYQTQGDANDSPDSDLVDQSDIIGKVYVKIPLIGYSISFARTPLGFFALILLPAGVIIYEEVRTIREELGKNKNGKKKSKKKKTKKPFTLPNVPKVATPTSSTSKKDEPKPSPTKVSKKYRPGPPPASQINTLTSKREVQPTQISHEAYKPPPPPPVKQPSPPKTVQTPAPPHKTASPTSTQSVVRPKPVPAPTKSSHLQQTTTKTAQIAPKQLPKRREKMFKWWPF